MVSKFSVANTEQVGQGDWAIDFDWYKRNNRSFYTMAQNCLCPKCKKRLSEKSTPADVVSHIKKCCSKTPDFINGRLPVIESAFRLFLSNGNHPMNLEELGLLLDSKRGSEYRTQTTTLSRILNKDQFYGIRMV